MRYETELEAAERRIKELRTEINEAKSLICRMREHGEDAEQLIDSWIEAFNMQLGDDGRWDWDPSFAQGEEWYEKYRALLKDWNAAVSDFNSTIRHRPVGRPLLASEAQVAAVLKLRRQGVSLRNIADEINLSKNTVCTIVGNESRTTRAWHKRYERVMPDKLPNVRWRARSRTREALPKQINELIKTGRELVKEAKGLGRGR